MFGFGIPELLILTVPLICSIIVVYIVVKIIATVWFKTKYKYINKEE